MIVSALAIAPPGEANHICDPADGPFGLFCIVLEQGQTIYEDTLTTQNLYNLPTPIATIVPVVIEVDNGGGSPDPLTDAKCLSRAPGYVDCENQVGPVTMTPLDPNQHDYTPLYPVSSTPWFDAIHVHVFFLKVGYCVDPGDTCQEPDAPYGRFPIVEEVIDCPDEPCPIPDPDD